MYKTTINYYKIIFITSKKFIIKNQIPPLISSTFPRNKQFPQVVAKQNDLVVHDEWEVRAGQPNHGPETVPVNHRVQQCR